LFTKTAVATSFMPLAFFAFDYYNNGSIISSMGTMLRDFMWPVSVVAAKACNASPY